MLLGRQPSAISWSRIGTNYLAEFYSDNSELFESVAAFLSASFKEEKAGIVIASEKNLRGIEQALLALGLDLRVMQQRGLYIPLDAKATLERVMVNHRPDQDKFLQVIGALVSQASACWGEVRAFSEMAATLWRQSNHAAAIELESFWNDLVKVHPLRVILRLSERRLHCR